MSDIMDRRVCSVDEALLCGPQSVRNDNSEGFQGLKKGILFFLEVFCNKI